MERTEKVKMLIPGMAGPVIIMEDKKWRDNIREEVVTSPSHLLPQNHLHRKSFIYSPLTAA